MSERAISLDTETYAAAAGVFRTVLAGVRPDRLHDPTPCEPFNVAQLVDKVIGHQDDLAPDLANELLDISRTQLVPLRGEGGFFGPEFVPPPGSPPADVLTGFLGRNF